MSFTFQPIGTIHSPWKEKFAVPRQPGLIQDGGGELRLLSPYNQPEAVRGLEAFSHLWLLFVFHQTMAGGWRPTAMRAWASSPPDPPFVPTRSACRW